MVPVCDTYKEELSSYLDGQLDDIKTGEVAAHLAECAGCRHYFKQIKTLSTAIGDSVSPENLDVPDLWPGIKEKLGQLSHVSEEDLSAYLDGELTQPVNEGVTEHIKSCQECHARFEGLTETNRLLASAMKLPENKEVNLWAGVKSRINEDCALIQSELSAYVDQEVVTLRHRAITEHLLSCPNCRGQFEAMSEIGDTIRSFYQPELPEDFDLWPGIKDKLKVVPFTHKARSKRKQLAHRLYLTGAAAVVMGVIGTLVYFVSSPVNNTVRPVSAEAYLLESAIREPADSVEAVVYEYPELP